MSNSSLPATFAERVKERISNTIADLIPDEAVGQLVDAQLQQFMKVDLPKLISDEIRLMANEKIKAALHDPKFQGQWDSMTGDRNASEFVMEAMTKAAPQILASMMQSAALYVVEQLRNGNRIY